MRTYTVVCLNGETKLNYSNARLALDKNLVQKDFEQKKLVAKQDIKQFLSDIEQWRWREMASLDGGFR